jgi:NADH-quinone oxidoreductase subunit J
MVEAVLFYAFAVDIIVSALFMVFSKNIFHSAFYLATSLFGVAAIYIVLNAYFIAAIQVLIYIGAVVVLAIFVINLTKEITGEKSALMNRNLLPAACVSVLTAALIILALLKTPSVGDMLKSAVTVDFTQAIGRQLLGNFVLAFEAVSFLLLAALIAAIVIVTKDDEEAK